MAPVEPRDVAPAERLHHRAQAVGAVARRREQVHVVGHQHVGVDVDAGHEARLAQMRAPRLPILVVDEDRLPVVPDLHQVVRQAGQRETGEAGHCPSLAGPHC
jgi:hypothetical protein